MSILRSIMDVKSDSEFLVSLNRLITICSINLNNDDVLKVLELDSELDLKIPDSYKDRMPKTVTMLKTIQDMKDDKARDLAITDEMVGDVKIVMASFIEEAIEIVTSYVSDKPILVTVARYEEVVNFINAAKEAEAMYLVEDSSILTIVRNMDYIHKALDSIIYDIGEFIGSSSVLLDMIKVTSIDNHYISKRIDDLRISLTTKMEYNISLLPMNGSDYVETEKTLEDDYSQTDSSIIHHVMVEDFNKSMSLLESLNLSDLSSVLKYLISNSVDYKYSTVIDDIVTFKNALDISLKHLELASTRLVTAVNGAIVSDTEGKISVDLIEVE